MGVGLESSWFVWGIESGVGDIQHVLLLVWDYNQYHRVLVIRCLVSMWDSCSRNQQWIWMWMGHNGMEIE